MARRRVREAQRPTTPHQHRGEIDGAQQPSDVASTGSPKRGLTPVESAVRHVAHLLPARTCPQLRARQCARVGRSGCPRLRGGSGSQPPSPVHNHRVLASVAAWRFVALVVVAVLAAVIQARLVQRQCLHSPPHASTFHAPMAVEGAPSEVVGVPQESVEETPSWKTEHPIIFDVLHSATDGLNAWIHEYNDVTDWLLVAHAVFYDILCIHFSIVVILGSPTARPLITMFALLLLRSVSQAAFHLPCPPGFYWHHPGFPSLSVDYNPAADFFFSGHTASLLTVGAEYWHMGRFRAACTTFFAVPLVVLMVIVCRIHYTGDVIAALLASYVAVSCGAAWERLVMATAPARDGAAFTAAPTSVARTATATKPT